MEIITNVHPIYYESLPLRGAMISRDVGRQTCTISLNGLTCVSLTGCMTNTHTCTHVGIHNYFVDYKLAVIFGNLIHHGMYTKPLISTPLR